MCVIKEGVDKSGMFNEQLSRMLYLIHVRKEWSWLQEKIVEIDHKTAVLKFYKRARITLINNKSNC